jgi:hypothetical protein
MTRTPIFVVAFWAFTALSATAQPHAESRRISWYVDVYGGHPTEAPRTFRLFDEAEDLVLRLSIMNEFDTPLFVDQQVLRQALGTTLSSAGQTVDVVVEWQPSIRLDGESFRTPLSGPDKVRVDGERGVRLFLRLRPANGERFAAGTYQIDVAMQPPLAAFYDAEGQPWSGPPIAARTTLTVVMNKPLSTQERVLQAMTEGSFAAFEEGNWAGAAAAYRRAVALAPGNDDAKSMLATSYLRLKRYREAITLLEEILPRRRGPRGEGGALVLAYMGLGDEVNAARVLQAEGFSSEQAAVRIAEVRENLQRSR